MFDPAPIEQTAITEPLDVFLRDIVKTLHAAADRGLQSLNDQSVADKTLQDCKEILDVIMAGRVEEWVAT